MRGQMFKRLKTCLSAVSLVCVLACSGCVYLIVGGIGALGGYVISPDTIEGISQHDKDEVWGAAEEIVSVMGIIESQDQATGVLLAKIDKASITITVESLSTTATQLRVKARKYHLPRISIAQEIYVKIMSYLVD